MKALLLTICAIALFTGCVSSTKSGAIGITRQQFFLVSAVEVERSASAFYLNQSSKAKAAGRLISEGPEIDRLRKIAARLIPQSIVFRDDTKHWKWEVTLIDEPTLNATCAAGGKITFYTGIIRQLKLTDDEIAAIMGHEIAHALREHSREKLSAAMGQQLIIGLASKKAKQPEQARQQANQMANLLFALPNNRGQESEADKIGLELMARAGYDPASAINVWRKMSAVAQGRETPEFQSTHPSHATRIKELTELQSVVQPLYKAAPKP